MNKGKHAVNAKIDYLTGSTRFVKALQFFVENMLNKDELTLKCTGRGVENNVPTKDFIIKSLTGRDLIEYILIHERLPKIIGRKDSVVINPFYISISHQGRYNLVFELQKDCQNKDRITISARVGEMYPENKHKKTPYARRHKE